MLTGGHKSTILGLMVISLAFLILPTVSLAGDLPIGANCNDDSECITDECQDSDLPIENDNYCTCDSDEDCAIRYGLISSAEEWDCESGITASRTLNYCKSNERENMFPINATEIMSAVKAKEAEEKRNKRITLAPPKLNIPIPEMSEMPSFTVKSGTSVSLPWTAQYLTAVIKWGAAISSVFAILMLIIGGILYIIAGFNQTLISQAKSIIFGSLFGLIILLSSYLILNIVNPRLTRFDPIQVDILAGTEYEVLTDDQAGSIARRGKIIKNIIGEIPEGKAFCSPEAAQWAAEELHYQFICVGPCHCAFTASRFLNYLGCGNPYHGGAPHLAIGLDMRGWITQAVTPENSKDLPVGLLYHKGHVGVSLGNGKDFESSTGKDFLRVSNAAGGTCPPDFRDVLGDGGPCYDCSPDIPDHGSKGPCDDCSRHIPDHGPQWGKYGAKKLVTDEIKQTQYAGNLKGAGNCAGNQGWTMGKVAGRGWKVVISPPGSVNINPLRGCCTISKNVVRKGKAYVSETICNTFIEHGTATSFSPGGTKESCVGTTSEVESTNYGHN